MSLLDDLPDDVRADSEVLVELMQRVTGHEPHLWNVGTLGFDLYHYKYATGREGDGHVLGFYPRKNKITIYLMDGTARHDLSSLGVFTTTGYCIYVKQLSDIDLGVLERVLRDSYDFIKAQGVVDRILWK